MITYFPHDVNARNDEKLLSLRMEMGATGVGIYWMLLEKLATANEQRLEYNLNKLSWDLHCEWNDIKDVIEKYDLFEIDTENNTFYSQRLCEHAQQVESVAAKRSRAGRAGAEAKNGAQPSTAMRNGTSGEVPDETIAKQMPSKCRANAEQNDGKCQANAEPKKRIEKNKEKENKIKEKSSSSKSEDAHVREEEAAEAAEEEEDIEYDHDPFELYVKAKAAMGEIRLPPDTDEKDYNRLMRWLTTPNDTDRNTLKTIMISAFSEGKEVWDLLRAIQVADTKRPINPLEPKLMNAIRYIRGLKPYDVRKIRDTVGRNKRRWEALAEAVAEADGNEKIKQPVNFILSRLKQT